MNTKLLAKNKLAIALAIATFSFQPTDSLAQVSFGAQQNNPFSLTAVGVWSAPAFADLDNDGDQDMMSGEQLGGLYYFENTGSATAPAFGAVQSNPFSLTTIGTTSTLSFGDLDNDGDFDIMAGEMGGNFKYFENTGSVSAPAYGAVQTNPFGLSMAPGFANYNTCLADMDNDNDLDLWFGDYDGLYYYYENTGSVSAPAFGGVQTNPFSIASNGSLSSPALGDVDLDGDLDLITGENSGTGDLRYFENTGSASAASFAAVQTNPFGLTSIGGNVLETALVDLDGDTDMDLMVGNTTGGFYYFENTMINAGISEGQASDFTVAPNPTKGVVNISYSEGNDVSYKVASMSGQIIQEGNSTGNSFTLDLSNQENGMYFVTIQNDASTETIRIIKE